MIFYSKQTETKLKETLVSTRSMTSLIEKEMSLATGGIKRETVNWVPMWVDWNNSVRSETSSATAMRAITDKGELLWYVRHDVKKHGYHSTELFPFDAIREANAAWDQRQMVKRKWSEVVTAQKELLRGSSKYRVTMQDAEDSALCTLGIAWFRMRWGIGRKASISGRMAAILMAIEPQVGFVIYQAQKRQAGQSSAQGLATSTAVAT
ncbi:MAG: hypothetical protein ABJJ53_17165 [Sulfitobacter sp.]